MPPSTHQRRLCDNSNRLLKSPERPSTQIKTNDMGRLLSFICPLASSRRPFYKLMPPSETGHFSVLPKRFGCCYVAIKGSRAPALADRRSYFGSKPAVHPNLLLNVSSGRSATR